MKKLLFSISIALITTASIAQLKTNPYNGTIPGGKIHALPIIQTKNAKTTAANDLSYSAFDTVTYYIITPISQVQPLHFGGTIKNSGTNTATNLGMSIDITNSSMVNVFSDASNKTDSLVANATVKLTTNDFTPAYPDLYSIRFGTYMDQTDADTTNNVYFGGVLVSDTTYGRDNGQVTSSLGIGSGQVGYLGQDFEIFNAAQATSVSFFVTKGYTGKKAAAVIWNMANGKPNNIIAGTDTMLYPNDSAHFYTIPLTQPLTMSPGKYVVTLIEFDSTLTIGTCPNLFVPKTTWINWPSNPLGGWANNEDFGNNFKASYVIRLNLDAITAVSKKDQTISTHVYPNPANNNLTVSVYGINKSNTTIELYDNKGSLVYNETLYLMNDQKHQIDIANLSDGIYILKVITAEGVSVNKITKHN